MKKIILTVGLPASGKTTWATQFVKSNPDYVNICKDDLRLMLHGTLQPKNQKEKFVHEVQRSLIWKAISLDKNVILSDTFLNLKTRNEIFDIFSNKDLFDVQIKDFRDVPVSVCLERNELRKKKVPRNVILGMYKSYRDQFPEQEVQLPNFHVKQDLFLKPAIICDVDGTLAHMHGRSPYDWSRVDEDICDHQVREILEFYSKNGRNIIILSGRDGICYQETYNWLVYNNVPFTLLLMRKEKDDRADHIIKEEIFRNEILPYYNVEAVFDDRLSVCQMWHRLGLKLFRLGDPTADF
jgi:predicted kinase